ncbi:cysteine-rich receptor-like protein kinase 38 isoform X3 [Brassica rapa]|uniref:cysteine-rich receptor-like protein kinase 38 isoform X3 n=1 Tax=Brassica campestris TaxID=3711 RepID=UPI0004F19B04|nr:cysteine-rich receptor-like protein kinase 38 isoform X3 [Brassica rapa]
MKNIATILLSISLLFQTLNGVKAGFHCVGDTFTANSSYGQNRDSLFSSLASQVITNRGFYNASLNSVHAVALCRRGYERQACINCVEKAIRQIKTSCSDRVESFDWDGDDADQVSCLVRATNHSTFQKLDLGPATNDVSPVNIDSSTKNMTLFRQEWEATVNRTLEAAIVNTSASVLKYYGVANVEFVEFPNVYMMMQCTPDITSGECKTCLEECVTYFRDVSWGKDGGTICRPGCLFRWNLYSFYGAFANITRVPAPPRPLIPQAQATSATSLKGTIIAIVVVPTVIHLFVLLGLIRAYRQIKKSKDETSEEDCISDSQFMLRFDLSMVLVATRDFSPENKIGQGGFGSVYKGILPSGQEIAVKRLTRGSGQGEMEFKNEVLLLTRLQHRNLVKLLGFCSEGEEDILIYEHVPNSSLDHFIFNQEKRVLLTWNVRYRIIEGVARGLLYLHEDSQLRIIHRDLKASNILLDADMNPKVSDFGMARLFNMDQTKGVTRRRVGTFGYMPPEYVKNGRFSAKTDVYSFGVVLLEMITGQSNKNYFESLGLPAYAWKSWVAGEAASIIDPVLSRTPTNEILRFIHIGLLCVQENVAKRPTMSLVIQWLSSDTIAIPLPTIAAFTTTELHRTDAMNQAKGEAGTLSLNKLSVSELSPR